MRKCGVCVCVCDTTGSGTPEATPELLERSGLRDARDIAPSVACVTMDAWKLVHSEPRPLLTLSLLWDAAI